MIVISRPDISPATGKISNVPVLAKAGFSVRSLYSSSHKLEMDHFDDIYKDRVQAIWRAMYATKFMKDDNEPCKIEEGLFLGSLGAAMNKLVLKKLNITHILTVAGSIAPAHPNDFTYKVVEVADREDTNLALHFDECIDFIEEAKRSGGGVLVHCFVGRSRSVTIVLAYLIKKRGMRLSQALDFVRSKRPQASPNPGFIRQLQNYEQSFQAQASVPN